MQAIEISADDLRPIIPAEPAFMLAQKILGWRWWAYRWGQRDAEHNYVKVRVRSLRPPDWPDARWIVWGNEGGNDLRLADGTEPLHRCESTGDAYALHTVPEYWKRIEAAEELACAIAKGGWRVSVVVGPKRVACTLSSRTRMIAGHGKTMARAISDAAMKLPDDWRTLVE